MRTENVCLLVCSLEWWTIYNGFTPARQPANLLGVRAAGARQGNNRSAGRTAANLQQRRAAVK